MVLIALLIRGLTLDGYKKGIDFYMTADWEKLKEPKVFFFLIQKDQSYGYNLTCDKKYKVIKLIQVEF